MGSDYDSQAFIKVDINAGAQFLQEFKLYETRSNFYMIGWNKNKDIWKVLKIDRLESSELKIFEDPTTYSEFECRDLLSRINEGNKSTDGLKFVTMCYGIVGFIKFVGPYYMLLITERKEIGSICGHTVYAISKSKMIPIPSSALHSDMDFSKNENRRIFSFVLVNKVYIEELVSSECNRAILHSRCAVNLTFNKTRYKKLLSSMDLTKDFFFSYSYQVMHSLQKNFCNHDSIFDNMFVWNEFLTRGIHNHIHSSMFTVALVHGFFKQVNLFVSDREFKLILVARRSRHYAGTRYLKRGVNKKGRVANDVETEQIAFEELPEGSTVKISTVVQNRGSIPLFWSQETPRLNVKPDIILSNEDQKYHATRFHFENLVKRYGNPIIILNLIKTHEKKPRESVLCAEFAHAISLINKELLEENRLKFLHWDLSKYSKIETIDVLSLLCKVAAYALNYTGIFCCQIAQSSGSEGLLNYSLPNRNNDGFIDAQQGAYIETKYNINNSINSGDLKKHPILQNGVLRTNCIDCLDRTNVAQYAFGLVSLGHQLHALGITDDPTVDMDSPLADDIMSVYELMGDTLALQYGGSPTHNKIFCQRRGQWNAATQSQDIFKAVQRYYNNVYMDFDKQDAINLFLGYFQPQPGKPALWELNSDQHSIIGRHGSNLADENERASLKRSQSDGNIQSKNNSAIEETDVGQNEDFNQLASEKKHKKCLSDSIPGILDRDIEWWHSRYTSSMSSMQFFPDMKFFPDMQLYHAPERGYIYNNEVNPKFSNFLGFDWVSTGNSCDEDTHERSTLISSRAFSNMSSDSVGSSPLEPISILKNPDALAGYSDRFVNWTMNGGMFD